MLSPSCSSLRRTLSFDVSQLGRCTNVHCSREQVSIVSELFSNVLPFLCQCAEPAKRESTRLDQLPFTKLLTRSDKSRMPQEMRATARYLSLVTCHVARSIDALMIDQVQTEHPRPRRRDGEKLVIGAVSLLGAFHGRFFLKPLGGSSPLVVDMISECSLKMTPHQSACFGRKQGLPHWLRQWGG